VTHVQLTPAWVANAVGGRLTGGQADRGIREVVIDSREAGPDDLFVAIKGPRFDGHDFVAEVLARGAAAAIVDHNAGRTDGALIEVDDTLKALQDLAHAVRMAAGTRVIAITGSAGKTTTKTLIVATLGPGTVATPRGSNRLARAAKLVLGSAATTTRPFARRRRSGEERPRGGAPGRRHRRPQCR